MKTNLFRSWPDLEWETLLLLIEQMRAVEVRIGALEKKLKAWHRMHEANCRLGRMSKRGDRHLLVHGVRAVLRWTRARQQELSGWVQALLARRPTGWSPHGGQAAALHKRRW